VHYLDEDVAEDSLAELTRFIGQLGLEVLLDFFERVNDPFKE
jgi:hypothetical protein